MPVTTEFLERMPGTVELTICAMIFAIGVGIPLGYLAARKHGSWLDSASVIGSLLGVAIPVFFLAYLLRLAFAVELGWLPGSGRQDVRIDATRITNFYVLDGLLTREWDAAWDAVLHLILPAIALGHHPAGDHRADHPGLRPRRRQRGLRADGEREGPGHGHRAAAAHPSQRPAAGVHHDRPADRPAAVGRGAHRDRVRLRRVSVRRSTTPSSPGTSPSCRASSSCWRSCTCW